MFSSRGLTIRIIDWPMEIELFEVFIALHGMMKHRIKVLREEIDREVDNVYLINGKVFSRKTESSSYVQVVR
jgi:hypothetical protein